MPYNCVIALPMLSVLCCAAMFMSHDSQAWQHLSYPVIEGIEKEVCDLEVQIFLGLFLFFHFVRMHLSDTMKMLHVSHTSTSSYTERILNELQVARVRHPPLSMFTSNRAKCSMEKQQHRVIILIINSTSKRRPITTEIGLHICEWFLNRVEVRWIRW